MFNNIEASELVSKIGRINIIDIRDNYIYNLGYIPTAKNIPSNLLLMNKSQYLNKESEYCIYCSKGISSSKVCKQLSLLGYKVYNLVGGYEGYKNYYK